MSIYSVRLAAGSQAAGTSSIVFTAPAGKVTVVRDIRLGPQSAVPGIAAVNLTGVAELFCAQGTTQYVTAGSELRAVLNPGDTLTMDAISGTWSYLISGYELA